MTASDILRKIKSEYDEVEYFNFIEYRPYPGLRKRTQNPLDIDSLIKHSSVRPEFFRIYSSEINKMEENVLGNSDNAIGLVSIVGSTQLPEYHIPMMDFKCQVRVDNEQAVGTFFSRISLTGYLFNSGNSYHFFGDRLMNIEEWRSFNYLCLLMTGFIDERYVAHRLLSGFSVLRVNRTEMKPNMPKFIGKIG